MIRLHGMPDDHVNASLGKRTWNEPSAVDFSAIGTLYKPLMPPFVKNSAIYMLVKFNVLLHVPDLLDVLEVST